MGCRPDRPPEKGLKIDSISVSKAPGERGHRWGTKEREGKWLVQTLSLIHI